MNDKPAVFERILVTNLQRTIDFVKFAEAKNAALLTFCSGWILALLNMLTKDGSSGSEYEKYIAAAIPLFSISGLICIVSFLPRINLEKFHQDQDHAKSLLFFKDIATFESTEFAGAIRERYIPLDKREISKNYLDDLTIQVFANSKVATRKFRMFNIAASLVMAAIVLLTAPFAGRAIENGARAFRAFYS